MFIAPLFEVAKIWKKQNKTQKTKNQMTNRSMKQQIAVHPHNGIIFGNKKKWITDAPAWMNLTVIMLNERSQIPFPKKVQILQKNTYYISFIENAN